MAGVPVSMALSADGTKLVLAAISDTIYTRQTTTTPGMAGYKPPELIRFVNNDFGPRNVICGRAEMPEWTIYDRTKPSVTNLRTSVGEQ